jgi:hypothetical protein
MLKRLLVLLIVPLVLSCTGKDTRDPETRVVEYLQKNVTPGKPVLVTELLSNVFTEPEEQQAVQHLYDALFQLPAFVAKTYMDSGKIPTRNEITSHFNFKVPGTTDVLLRILESDPRVPRFFQRAAAGEITAVDVEAIRNTEKFGKPLQSN